VLTYGGRCPVTVSRRVGCQFTVALCGCPASAPCPQDPEEARIHHCHATPCDLNAPLDKTYITCCNLLIVLLLMSMVHQRVLVPRVTCRPARVHAQAAAQACGRWPFGLGPPPARLSLVRSSKYEKRTKLETCAVSLVRDHPRTKPGLYLGCISAVSLPLRRAVHVRATPSACALSCTLSRRRAYS